jgi:hypothetical protein
MFLVIDSGIQNLIFKDSKFGCWLLAVGHWQLLPRKGSSMITNKWPEARSHRPAAIYLRGKNKKSYLCKNFHR